MSEVERFFSINIFTKVSSVSEAHALARQIVEAIGHLPNLLTASTTIASEEPVDLVLVRKVDDKLHNNSVA